MNEEGLEFRVAGDGIEQLRAAVAARNEGWLIGPGPYSGAVCITGQHVVGEGVKYRLVRASVRSNGRWYADTASPASIITCIEHDVERGEEEATMRTETFVVTVVYDSRVVPQKDVLHYANYVYLHDVVPNVPPNVRVEMRTLPS